MSVGIVTFHSANNYGAVLQCYALSEVLKELGCQTVELIDLPLHAKPKNWRSRLRSKVSGYSFSGFRRNFLPDVVSRDKKKSLYVFGSDQIWNPQITKSNAPLFFGSWVDEVAPKVSYAASFGLSMWNFPEYSNLVKELLKSFHSIAVRESSGVDICKDIFSIEASKVVDPTLLLTDYNAVFKQRKPSNTLACYIFSKSEKNLEGIVKLGAQKKLKPVLLNDFRLRKGIKSIPFPTVSKWLSHIESSEVVLTDSFHCMVFSIVFKKDFIAIPAIPERAGRMLSLLQDLGLESRFFNSIDEIDTSDEVNNKVDYKIVHNKLKTLREDSILFLKNVLSEVEC